MNNTQFAGGDESIKKARSSARIVSEVFEQALGDIVASIRCA